jgi:hypothetical protein
MATLAIKDGAGADKSVRTTNPTGDEHIPHHNLVNSAGTVIGEAGAPVIVSGGASADYDTGGGTSTVNMVGIALPASGGPVAGGTATNPVVVSVNGTAAVSVSGVATAANQATTNTNLGATTDAESSSGDGTLIAIAKRIRTLLGGLIGVTPQMSSAAHISVTTNSTGANYQQFGSQACKQVLISNQTGVSLEFNLDGSTGPAVRIPTGAIVPFYGLSNANQLYVRRVDQSNTTVSFAVRCEA